MIQPIPRRSAPTPQSLPWPTPRLRPAQAAPVRRESSVVGGGMTPMDAGSGCAGGITPAQHGFPPQAPFAGDMDD